MKICVYAICKNEEKFIKRWYDSIKDADYICVLDTGSTDNSVKLLKSLHVKVVKKKIEPFRFDTARNMALKLVPKDIDICVSLDMDEVMNEGWKENILRVWKSDTTRLRYIYNWLIEDNQNKVSFYGDKIHKRKSAKWVGRVHEILVFPFVEKQIYTDKVIINHYPDRLKSRASYLPLLKEEVNENPDNDRNMHYLGREYMYYKKYNKAIDTLIKHLNLKTATWKDERCASMRYIARCYVNLNRYNEADMWLNLAIKEAPYLRDPYVELAILYYNLKDYPKTITYLNKALEIKDNPRTYINEAFSYDETINDLLCLSYFKIGNIDLAIKNAKMALKINPSNERIKENLELLNKLKTS